MENKDIKKAYQKMSRQLKKQGLNYTCVMNARQQALGTATICIKFVIDKVIDEMKKRRDAAGRELEYLVFDMYFMQGMTYEQIIEQVEKDRGETLGKNTPRRWVTGIINEMSVLLWGLEDERLE